MLVVCPSPPRERRQRPQRAADRGRIRRRPTAGGGGRQILSGVLAQCFSDFSDSLVQYNPPTPPGVERARPSALSSCPLNFFLIMLQSIYPAGQKSYQTCQPTNQQPASQPDRQPAASSLQSTCYRATIRPSNSVNIPASQAAPSQAGVPKNLIF